MTDSVDRVSQVEHADNVVHADHATSVGSTEKMHDAEHADTIAHVDHATSVGTVETMVVRDAVPDRTKRLTLIRDISGFVVVSMALVVTFFVILSKDNQTNRNAHLLQQATEHLACTGRYQDAVDAASTETIITIGELVVIITNVPPGPDRVKAVADKITELHRANEASRLAVNDKIAYNNAGLTLPCPIAEAAITPAVIPPSTTRPTTTPSSTPTP